MSDIYSASGFKRINSLCKDAKIKFSYEIDEAGVTFIIHRKKAGEISSIKTNVTVNVPENVTLNKMEKLVYQLFRLHFVYQNQK